MIVWFLILVVGSPVWHRIYSDLRALLRHYPGSLAIPILDIGIIEIVKVKIKGGIGYSNNAFSVVNRTLLYPDRILLLIGKHPIPQNIIIPSMNNSIINPNNILSMHDLLQILFRFVHQ